MDDFRKNPGGFPPFSFPEEGWRGRNRKNGMALPFYRTFPIPMFWEEEETASRDLDYLVQLYPEQAKKYRQRISRMLDGMDYQGSMIYDEYPDRRMLKLMSDSIGKKIDEELSAQSVSSGFSGELAEVLFYHGIYRRRCRRKRCRGY